MPGQGGLANPAHARHRRDHHRARLLAQPSGYLMVRSQTTQHGPQLPGAADKQLGRRHPSPDHRNHHRLRRGFRRGQIHLIDPVRLGHGTGDTPTKTRQDSKRMLDPRFMLGLDLPQAVRREVLRLVIDLFMVALAQQDQVLIAIDRISSKFAIAGTARRARRYVSLIADNCSVVARRPLRDENPTAQCAPVA